MVERGVEGGGRTRHGMVVGGGGGGVVLVDGGLTGGLRGGRGLVGAGQGPLSLPAVRVQLLLLVC